MGRVPASGEIVHAGEAFEQPAGGGSVAAIQLLKLAGECAFFTALSSDAAGRAARERLEAMGLRVEAAETTRPQRRAITHLDGEGERTITVIGERLEPQGKDPLPWELLDGASGVYFCAGDAAALVETRRARAVVATTRVAAVLAEAEVQLDAVVGSASDGAERYEPGSITPPPRLVVTTRGAEGGTWQLDGEPEERYPPAPLPGPVADSYGCGDSFAAGLAFALGEGVPPEDALALAARCGAACLTGRGPYAGQLEGPV